MINKPKRFFLLVIVFLMHVLTIHAQTQVYHGILSTESPEFFDFGFANFFYINVDSGSHITLELKSSNFAAWLIVISPSGKLYNADYDDTTKTSLLPLINMESGKWYIIVTSFIVKELGDYELSTNSSYPLIQEHSYQFPKDLEQRYFSIKQKLMPIKLSNNNKLYPLFPWPPPQASATTIIPPQFLVKPNKQKTFLSNIEQKLFEALTLCGYDNISYYAVPDGFALVTRLEQINIDGVSKFSPERWATNIQPLRIFSITKYAQALFTAPIGYYRVIVFIVTSLPFNQSTDTISSNAAIAWLSSGLNRLPEEIGKLEFRSDYKCTVLIYEFEQLESAQKTNFKFPSRLSGNEHLEKSKILENLTK